MPIFVENYLMKKNSLLNLQYIRSKMKDQPKKYKMYNYFVGIDGTLTVSQLTEIRNITKKETEQFLSKIDKAITKLSKTATS